MIEKDFSFNLKKVEVFRVLELLNGVKINKVIGIDKILNRILKLVVFVIYKSLIDLFNLFIILGVFLFDWKIVKVFLFFKLGDLSDVNNYRLIFVLLIIV